jgi:hypothetical protein
LTPASHAGLERASSAFGVGTTVDVEASGGDWGTARGGAGGSNGTRALVVEAWRKGGCIGGFIGGRGSGSGRKVGNCSTGSGGGGAGGIGFCSGIASCSGAGTSCSDGDGGTTGASVGAGISAGTGASGMAVGATGSDDTDGAGANTKATVRSSGGFGATGNRTIVSKTTQTATCSSIAAPAETAEGRIFGKACGQRTDLAISDASLSGRTCGGLRIGTL